jgi:hypothetical protein
MHDRVLVAFVCLMQKKKKHKHIGALAAIMHETQQIKKIF